MPKTRPNGPTELITLLGGSLEKTVTQDYVEIASKKMIASNEILITTSIACYGVANVGSVSF